MNIYHVQNEQYEHYIQCHAFCSTFAIFIHPAQMATIARAATKLCANIRAEWPKITGLLMKSLESYNLGMLTECEPEGVSWVAKAATNLT